MSILGLRETINLLCFCLILKAKSSVNIYYKIKKVFIRRRSSTNRENLLLTKLINFGVWTDWMQEEGWVVCRAFRKPTPNHRQGFEPWNHSCYIRDCSHVRSISDQSHSDIVAATHLVHPNHQGTNFQQPFGSDNQQLDYIPAGNNSFFDNNQLIELPQLDSPTISTSLAAKDQGLHRNNNNIISINEDCEEERSNNNGAGQCNNVTDWKNLDNLLESQVLMPFQNTMPLTPQNFELEAQGHVGHILGFLHGDS